MCCSCAVPAGYDVRACRCAQTGSLVDVEVATLNHRQRTLIPEQNVSTPDHDRHDHSLCPNHSQMAWLAESLSTGLKSLETALEKVLMLLHFVRRSH
jgi:hypothetical protein